MPTIGVYLDDELYIKVVETAKKENKSTSQMVKELIEKALNGGNGDDGEKVVE